MELTIENWLKQKKKTTGKVIRLSTAKSYISNMNIIFKLLKNNGKTLNKLTSDEFIKLLKSKYSKINSYRQKLKTLNQYLALFPVKTDFNLKTELKIEENKVASEIVAMDKKNEGKKTDYQKDNWATYKDLLKVYQTLKIYIKEHKMNYKKKQVLSKDERSKLSDYFIASLYLLDPEQHPPRRIMEYTEMFIISLTDYEKLLKLDDEGVIGNIMKEHNWLVVRSYQTAWFVFSYTKTSNLKGYESPMIKLSSKMQAALKIYLITYPNLLKKEITVGTGDNTFTFEVKPLLYNSNVNLLTQMDELPKNVNFKILQGNMTSRLQKIFKDTGKKISVNMLRKIVESYLHSDKQKAIEKLMKPMIETAKKMGHTISTAQKTYIKTDA
jgi:hypothetical protein